jgi:hypothetical protein
MRVLGFLAFSSFLSFSKPERYRDLLWDASYVADSDAVVTVLNELTQESPTNAPGHESIKPRIDWEDHYGRTAVLVCGADPQNTTLEVDQHCLHIAKELQTAGANLSHTDKYGWNAISHAASRGYAQLVAFLAIEGGIPLNARGVDALSDDKSVTPLMIAVEHRWPRVVKELVLAGASVRVRNKDGLTAIHMAARLASSKAQSPRTGASAAVPAGVSAVTGEDTPLFDPPPPARPHDGGPVRWTPGDPPLHTKPHLPRDTTTRSVETETGAEAEERERERVTSLGGKESERRAVNKNDRKKKMKEREKEKEKKTIKAPEDEDEDVRTAVLREMLTALSNPQRARRVLQASVAAAADARAVPKGRVVSAVEVEGGTDSELDANGRAKDDGAVGGATTTTTAAATAAATATTATAAAPQKEQIVKTARSELRRALSTRDAAGRTALMYAAANGCADTVRRT